MSDRLRTPTPEDAASAIAVRRSGSQATIKLVGVGAVSHNFAIETDNDCGETTLVRIDRRRLAEIVGDARNWLQWCSVSADRVAPMTTGRSMGFSFLARPHLDGQTALSDPAHRPPAFLMGRTLAQIHQLPVAHQRPSIYLPLADHLARHYISPESWIHELIRKSAPTVLHGSNSGTIQRLLTPSSFLTHGDYHLGNLLVTPEKRFYVIDWDKSGSVSKEFDLGFVSLHATSLDSPYESALAIFNGYLSESHQIDHRLLRLALYYCPHMFVARDALKALQNGDAARVDRLTTTASRFERYLTALPAIEQALGDSAAANLLTGGS